LKKTLFNGEGELDQIRQIFSLLGAPSDERWEGFSQLPGAQKFRFTGSMYVYFDSIHNRRQNNLNKRFTQQVSVTNNMPVLSLLGLDLLNAMLDFDPKTRITADEALKHPWFRESPLPKNKMMMPTFPATMHETGQRKRKHEEIEDKLSYADRELQDLYEQNVKQRDSIF
jgi:cell division cycle 2-like protein